MYSSWFINISLFSSCFVILKIVTWLDSLWIMILTCKSGNIDVSGTLSLSNFPWSSFKKIFPELLILILNFIWLKWNFIYYSFTVLGYWDIFIHSTLSGCFYKQNWSGHNTFGKWKNQCEFVFSRRKTDTIAFSHDDWENGLCGSVIGISLPGSWSLQLSTWITCHCRSKVLWHAVVHLTFKTVSYVFSI